mgnify:FL=1
MLRRDDRERGSRTKVTVIGVKLIKCSILPFLGQKLYIELINVLDSFIFLIASDYTNI